MADELGVDPATISRWESVEDPQKMGKAAERLLRLMTKMEKPKGYCSRLGSKEAKSMERVKVRPQKMGWVETSV